MSARRVPRLLVRPLIALAVFGALVLSTASNKVAAHTPLPPNITGPVEIGFAGATYSHVFAVSKTGYILGTSDTAVGGQGHRFVRTPDGMMFDLGINNWDGGYVSNNGFVTAINSLSNSGVYHAQFWSETTGWLDIPGIAQPMSGTTEAADEAYTYPSGINSSGVVFGFLNSRRPRTGETSGYHIFKWTRETGTVDLGDNGAQGIDLSGGMNESGQFAGMFQHYNNGPEEDHGFRWSASAGFEDLGTIAGHISRVRPFAINEAGEVAGFEYFPDSNTDHAVMWTPSGGLVDLFPATSIANYAFALNTRGQLAGFHEAPGQNYTPFFMESSSSPVQLVNSDVRGGVSRTGLNGFGQLVGSTYYVSGSYQNHPFYWSQADGFVDLGGDGDTVGITNSGLIAGNVNSKAVIWQVTSDNAGDTTAPTATIASPVDGATYTLGQVVNASFTCADNMELVSCSAPALNGAAIDTTTPGPHTFTVTAIDRYDNVTTRTVHYRTPDTAGPSIVTAFEDGVTLVTGQWQPLNARCDDAGGVDACVATDENAQPIGFFDGVNSSNGSHTITIVATDKSGNTSTKVIHYTAADDTFGPAVTIGAPVNGAAYSFGQQVTAMFSCDDYSGVSTCGPALDNGLQISSGNSLPTQTSGAHTFTVHAVDALGNVTDRTVTYTVLPPPHAVIVSPANGASYAIGATVTANYTCVAVLGVATCNGTQANGTAIDTSAPGTFQFNVEITDLQGNTGFTTVTYAVLAATVPAPPIPVPGPGTVSGPINLGTLGGSYSYAAAISKNGYVTGYSTVAGDAAYHGFFWSQAGGMVDIGNTTGAAAVSINGKIAGTNYAGNQGFLQINHAFSWTSLAGMVELAIAPFDVDGRIDATDVFTSRAVAVNAGGAIVGDVTNNRVAFCFSPNFCFYNSYTRGAFWKPDGTMVVLPTFGGNYSHVNAINDSGQVVGSANDANGQQHAFLWTSTGGMTDLGTLGGGNSEAMSINTAGVVTGSADTAEGQSHAFRWSASGGMGDLSPAASSAGGVAIGDNGQIVGRWNSGAGETGFSWTSAGGVTLMPDFGSGYSFVANVNLSGQIAGASYTTGYAEQHAAFWTADALSLTDLGPGSTVGVSNTHVAAGNDNTGHAVIWALPGFEPGQELDTTAPTATIAAPVNGATYTQGQIVNASYTCADLESGVDTCVGTVANGAAINTSVLGAHTFSVTATDVAGNTAAATVSYSVNALPPSLAFTGFLAPVDAGDSTGGTPTMPAKTFKAGSTIPLKFTLTSSSGQAVTTGVHTLQVIKVTSATTSGTALNAVAQGGGTTGNQFRLTGGQWMFNLDTKDTGMTAGVWKIIATLSDGTKHFVYVQLK
jgi:probable HAF family extracellular repeat protein